MSAFARAWNAAGYIEARIWGYPWRVQGAAWLEPHHQADVLRLQLARHLGEVLPEVRWYRQFLEDASHAYASWHGVNRGHLLAQLESEISSGRQHLDPEDDGF